ncbi:MAG: beta-agarase [Verrucomicrobiota bacterium]
MPPAAHHLLPVLIALSGSSLAKSPPAPHEVPDHLMLFDFEGAFDPGTVVTTDAKISLVGEQDKALRVETGHQHGGPGVTLIKKEGSWDLNPYHDVKMDITNQGEFPADIIFKVGNPSDGMEAWQMEIRMNLKPGETKTFVNDITTTPWRFHPPLELLAMRAAPGQSKSDLGAINQVSLMIAYPEHKHELLIDNIRATNPVRWIKPDDFLPFIDRFGQYVHADWPGKTYSVDDLKQQAREEDRHLSQNPGPKHFNQYGGWANGPQLEATGFFRAEKHEGAWWLVDPEGRLFWSHGVGCVNIIPAQTGTTDRESYFEWLPAKNSEFGRFYDKAYRASHGYYKTLAKRETYNFTASNLYKKYGQKWHREFRRFAHRRIRSWGMNTAAVASDPTLCRDGITPYTETVWVYNTKKIEASNGYWGKFHDVFDPSFRQQLKRALSSRKAMAKDSWCLGFFIENELSWGAEGSLAMASLASPPDQASKRVFIEDLKKRYGSIEKLNEAWGSGHASWQALLESTTRPNRSRAWPDLRAFDARIAETYFSTVREEMKAVAPNTMYLGCRLAWANSDVVIRTAAKYCDVISKNKYEFNVTNVGLPEGVDKPIVIGEFHFGSLDRGALHIGIREARNQSHRGELYTVYLESALRNPYIVGTHWFQYGDQSPTGRDDGENYNVGLVDVCDRPFPELIEKVREVGHGMYQLRHGASKDGGMIQPLKPSKVDTMRELEGMDTRSN